MTFTFSIWIVLLFAGLWIVSIFQMGIHHFFKHGHEQGINDTIDYLASVGYIVKTDDDYIIGLSNIDQLKSRGVNIENTQNIDESE